MADEQAISGGVQTTSINRSWMIKMVLFTVVLFGFGLWGLYDATIAYPTRGNMHAEYAKYRYLDAARMAGKINGTAERGDAKERLAELDGKTRSDLEQAEHDWLTALSRVGKLHSEEAKIDSPNRTLDELAVKWKSQQQPLPLTAYDMPLQWSFVVVGFGCGLWVLMNIVRTRAKKYSWDPASNTLTLPSGKAVNPDTLADVDKRKWYKYFCTLQFNDGTDPAELDLLKYQGLEEWVLTLERVRFPDRAAEADAEAAAEALEAEANADAADSMEQPPEQPPEDEKPGDERKE